MPVTRAQTGGVDSVTGETLVRPSGTTENGVVVKSPSASWGDGTPYGTAQAFMLLKEDTEGAVEPDDLVLFRSSYKGNMGLAGGMHVATGFRKRVGETFAYSMHVDPTDDVPGIYIDAANDAPVSEYLACRTNSGTVKLLVRADGKLEYDAPSVRVYNSGAISHATSGSVQTLTFDTERFDTDTMHSTSSNTERLTCRTAGVYVASAGVDFASNATGVRQAFVRHHQSDGTTIATVCQDLRNAVSGAATQVNIAGPVKMAVGEYLTLIVNQTSTGALNLNTPNTQFSAAYVGRGN